MGGSTRTAVNTVFPGLVPHLSLPFSSSFSSSFFCFSSFYPYPFCRLFDVDSTVAHHEGGEREGCSVSLFVVNIQVSNAYWVNGWVGGWVGGWVDGGGRGGSMSYWSLLVGGLEEGRRLE